jgi:transcriptional regulator GlxA family with amidase domain
MGHSTETLIGPAPKRYLAEPVSGGHLITVRPQFPLPPSFSSGEEVGRPSAPVPLVDVVIKLLDRAAEAIETDHAAAKDFIGRATALLEADHGRSDRERQGEAQAPARGGLTPWQVRQVTRHIDATMGSNISTDDCAAIARLSTSHFRRAFKASFGETFYGWLSRRRVQRAQEMMVMTDQPLYRIARQCGFADQSHFTRVFRRLVGPSPGSWRRL